MKSIILVLMSLVLPGIVGGTQTGVPAEGPVADTIGSSPARTGAPDTAVTLEELIDDVLRHNPRLAAARSRAKSAEARIPQASAWDDPLVGVEWMDVPITSGNPFRDRMETEYFLQQMIPFPGKKGLMGDAATAAAAMSGEDARAVERDLVAETKRAHAMLYSAQRRTGVNAENLVLVRQIIESVRAKYRVGGASQGDVLKAQVEEAGLLNERSVLGRELVSAASMINALRAAPASAPVGRLGDIEPGEITEDVEALSRRAVASRPEILAMKREIEMNGAEVSAARKEWLPDLMIKGTYKQTMDETDRWAAMIGINIPVAPWGIGKYSGRVEENEARLRASEQSLAEMENMVLSEVRNAHAAVLSGWERFGRYRSTVLPDAEQSYRSVLASYQNDQTDFLSLLDSFRMLQMLRMEYYMVVEEYLSGLAALERAVGGDLR